MFIHDLFEKRPDARRQPLIKKLEVFRDDPNVFVTFTNVLKLGVNPHSEWIDPIGIYAYPVQQIYEELEQIIIPWAGDRRYAFIFRSTGDMLELQQYDEDDLDADIQRIEKRFRSSLLKEPYGDDHFIPDPKSYWEHVILRWFERYSHNPGEGFWEITERVARHIALREPNRDVKMIWNSLIRACNYDAICDRGDGYINTNEPAQGVFLHAGAIQPIEAAVNDLAGSARP